MKKYSVAIGILLVLAFISFELFNFATSKGALDYFLKGKFLGLSVATILAIAACAADLGGLARMFTPQRGKDEPMVVYFLLVAWLFASVINAFLTWFFVLMNVQNTPGIPMFNHRQIMQVIPLLIAVFVCLVRIMIVGSVATAGEQILWGKRTGAIQTQSVRPATHRPFFGRQSPTPPVTALEPLTVGGNGTWKVGSHKPSD